MTRILALDPGPVNTAWCIYGGENIECGILSNDDVLYMLEVNRSHANDLSMVCEMIASYGMAVGKEVFETVFWIGRFCERWGYGHNRMFRRDVKLHLCGSAKAKDANVRQALIDKLGPPRVPRTIETPTGKMKRVSDHGPTYGVTKDMWAALGVAVTFAETVLK